MINILNIESHLGRSSNIKLFIDECNWKGLSYPLKIDDWKKNEKNDSTVAINILHIRKIRMSSVYFKS